MSSKKKKELTNKEKAAARIGCKPDELLKYREEPGGLIVAIAPDGRKFNFTIEDLTIQLRNHLTTQL